MHFDVKVMLISIAPERGRTIENHNYSFFVHLTFLQCGVGIRGEKALTGHANISACSDVCFHQGSF